jgi:hypothetical protein
MKYYLYFCSGVVINKEFYEMNNSKKLIAILFVLGLSLHILLALKSWVGGDQIHLLKLGTSFASTGQLTGFGKLTGGGGTNIGSFLEICVGVPLFFIQDYRSPMILIILFSVIAFYFLSKEFNKIWGYTGILVLSIIYWLSPVRIYNSGFLWEPSYIFLFSAIHFVSCFNLKNQKSFIYSFWLILSLFIALQIHNSALILFISTIYLSFTKKIRWDWKGISAGLIVSLITFVPTIISLINGKYPEMKSSEGYLFYGIIHVAPFLKGLFYAVKLGGFDMVRQIKETNYIFNGKDIVNLALQILCIISVIASVLASLYYFRSKLFKKYLKDLDNFNDNEKWLLDYAFSFVIALLISAGLSPLTLQGWMVVITLPALMLPMMSIIIKKSRGLNMKKKILLGFSYCLIQIIIILYIAFGKEVFNRPSQYPNGFDFNKDKIIMNLFSK